MSASTASAITARPRVEAVQPGAETQSYRQMLKSSALIGGSSVANIAIGALRTKVLAVLLGPAGVGLAGLYGSISDLTQSVAGMGVNSSGVRQIAEAAASNDTDRIARNCVVLRRTSILLGIIGGLFLVAASKPISRLTFGSDNHAGAISMLAVAVFFRLVAAGQGALINGMRRIADLAKMNVLGAISGTVISIVFVYFLRENGIVPLLIAVAAMTILTSWWYSRKIKISPPRMTFLQMGEDAAALLKLGFAFMASGLMTLSAAYLIRIIIIRNAGFEATGLYQAAWTLGGLYVGFILQAMGADFYPRLTAIAHDNSACNRMVNEQARIGLLLGGPGVIATLTLAPVIIGLFYSAKFHEAVGILRWICMGTILQVITWPMGFILLAKAKQKLFISSDLAWSVVYVGLAWLCVRSLGLNGAGIAFFGSYIFHWLLTYLIVRRLSGFFWSPENRRTGLAFLSLIAIAFGSIYVLPSFWATCVGFLALALSVTYSFRALSSLASLELTPGLFSGFRRYFPSNS